MAISGFFYIFNCKIKKICYNVRKNIDNYYE